MSTARAVALAPARVDAQRLRSLIATQPVLHKLYDAVSRDVAWLRDAIGSRLPPCAWQQKELEVFATCAPRAAQKPRLMLPNSVYLQEDRSGSVLTVTNVQAGEPYQVNVLHQQLSAAGASFEPGPLRAHCAALASAARLIHPAAPVVAVLSKPTEALAKRTAADVHGVGDTLLAEHGVCRVLYVSMRDLAEAQLERSTGDLVLGGHHISVVYSRFDFSHPFGTPIADAEAAGAELWREWETIEKMERSSAVISSDLGCRLAHRRGVAYALSRPGGVEHFLPDASEAAAVRRVLPEQWSLRACDGRSLEAATALLATDAQGFVAKNVLRPRTGSGATQGRIESGGLPITTPDGLRALLGDARREWHLLYRKLSPRTHSATVRHVDGAEWEVEGAESEVGVYGAYLALPGEEAMLNASAGVAARTRPADAGHALAAQLGYGAISAVAGVM